MNCFGSLWPHLISVCYISVLDYFTWFCCLYQFVHSISCELFSFAIFCWELMCSCHWVFTLKYSIFSLDFIKKFFLFIFGAGCSGRLQWNSYGIWTDRYREDLHYGPTRRRRCLWSWNYATCNGGYIVKSITREWPNLRLVFAGSCLYQHVLLPFNCISANVFLIVMFKISVFHIWYRCLLIHWFSPPIHAAVYGNDTGPP